MHVRINVSLLFIDFQFAKRFPRDRTILIYKFCINEENWCKKSINIYECHISRTSYNMNVIFLQHRLYIQNMFYLSTFFFAIFFKHYN